MNTNSTTCFLLADFSLSSKISDTLPIRNIAIIIYGGTNTPNNTDKNNSNTINNSIYLTMI